MVQGASSDAEVKMVAILRVLSESPGPLGSIAIARELENRGVFLSERGVRYYLRIMDERGFTQPLGRGGRQITPRGHEELRTALAPEQLRFILERLELLAFNTTFDPDTGVGQVAVNTSVFHESSFDRALAAMRGVFKAGICVSDMVAVAEGGAKLGGIIIPRGRIGFATVCGVTINGVLLKKGVPMESRFGGILEVSDWRPRRFTAIINYGGTSIDPSEQLIRARMTAVTEAVTSGEGRVLANFREILAASRPLVEETLTKLREVGIGGVYSMGSVSEPVCQIAVGLNRVGLVLVGGLNPIAAAAEAGIEMENYAESGMMDFRDMRSFWKL